MKLHQKQLMAEVRALVEGSHDFGNPYREQTLARWRKDEWGAATARAKRDRAQDRKIRAKLPEPLDYGKIPSNRRRAAYEPLGSRDGNTKGRGPGGSKKDRASSGNKVGPVIRNTQTRKRL